MANIFAILTGLVLAVSAFLAYANWGDETEAGKGYKGWIKKRTDEQASLDRNQKTHAGLVETLHDTESELADYNGKNETLQVEVDAQLAKNSDLQSKLEAKKASVEAKSAEVKQKEEAFLDVGEVEEVIAKLKRTQEQLAELGASIGEKTAERAGLESEKRDTETTIAGLKGQLTLRVSGKSDPGLRTSVRSVFRGLGFVTLSAGDNRGVVKESFLDVIRDGEVIGKLQVTTVEATTAAADIVPDSMPPGGSIVAGDIVVAEKEKPAAAPSAE